MPDTEGDYLTPLEVGRLLHLSPKKVNRLADVGTIPSVWTLGHRRFRRSDIEDLSGGLSGGREPRRPRPSPGSAGVAIPEP